MPAYTRKTRLVPFRMLAECYRLVAAFVADPLAALLLLVAIGLFAAAMAVGCHHLQAATASLLGRQQPAWHPEPDTADGVDLEHLWRLPAAKRSSVLRRRIRSRVRRRRATQSRL